MEPPADLTDDEAEELREDIAAHQAEPWRCPGAACRLCCDARGKLVAAGRWWTHATPAPQ